MPEHRQGPSGTRLANKPDFVGHERCAGADSGYNQFINLFTNQCNMVTDHALSICNLLASKPRSARQIVELLGISQATVSRAIQALGNEVIALGPYRSIQYALRRPLLATPDIPIYRVSPDSKIAALGTLSPVQPTGYVMTPNDGRAMLTKGFRGSWMTCGRRAFSGAPSLGAGKRAGPAVPAGRLAGTTHTARPA